MNIKFSVEATYGDVARAAVLLGNMASCLEQMEREGSMGKTSAPTGPIVEPPASPPTGPIVEPPANPPTSPGGKSSSGETDWSMGLDNDGLPWDSRINTKNKAKTAKGVFKLTKGKDKNFVAGVKAELKELVAQQDVVRATPPTGPGPVTPPAGPGPVDPPGPPAGGPDNPPGPPSAGPTHPHGGSPEMPPGPTPGQEVSLSGVMDKILNGLSKGALHKHDVDAALYKAGIQDLSQLNTLDAAGLQTVSEICEAAWKNTAQ